MTLDPETLQRITEEGAKQDAEDVIKALQQTLDEGWLMWAFGPPAGRKQGYKDMTLPGDEALVLTTDYLPLMKAGILPPLEAMYQLAEWQMAQSQPQVPGMPPVPPPPYDPHFFWGLLLPPIPGTPPMPNDVILPKEIFLWFQSDFRKLVKDEIKRAVEAGG